MSQVGSQAEQAQAAQTTRRAWALVSPALILLFIGAIGPLAVVVVYSFLTPGEYGGVEWVFSTDAWVKVLFEKKPIPLPMPI